MVTNELYNSLNKLYKKILIGLILTIFISSCFAGYSSGGRSGFSGGSRSFSSGSSYRSYSRPSYSYNRSEYRGYSAPVRSYSSSNRTVINNHHYSHGGSGFGHGFFGGMLGGMVGSSLMNNHPTAIVAGSAPVVVSQPEGVYSSSYSSGVIPQEREVIVNSRSFDPVYILASIFIWIALCILITKLFKWMIKDSHCNHRW